MDLAHKKVIFFLFLTTFVFCVHSICQPFHKWWRILVAKNVFRCLVEAWTFHAKAHRRFSHIAKFLVMKNSKYCFLHVSGSPCRDPHLIPSCRNFKYLVRLLFDLKIFWTLRHLSLNMYKSLSSQISWNLKNNNCIPRYHASPNQY